MQIPFINLEYFFLKIYDCVTGLTCQLDIDSFDFSRWISLLKIISIVISLLLLVGTVYSIIRIRQIRREEMEELGRVIVVQNLEDEKYKKWDQINAMASSQNKNDWRLAILEADILLDDMVDVMGYKGEGLGEKLKQIERSDFNTIDLAWEAHKIRNTIAHAGTDYILSQREARRVIGLYKQVFEEFEFI